LEVAVWRASRAGAALESAVKRRVETMDDFILKRKSRPALQEKINITRIKRAESTRTKIAGFNSLKQGEPLLLNFHLSTIVGNKPKPDEIARSPF